MLIAFVVVMLIQIFILYCCLVVGNDSLSRESSDQEQMECIRKWKE